MRIARGLLVLLLWLGSEKNGLSQRTYSAHSVLASGNWFRVAVKDPGIYRIDLAFLQNLGVNTQNLASASIRIYGNGGGMLPEANSGDWTDDLREIAIQVEDGNDGILNGADHILFYAEGPHKWLADPASQGFIHRLNRYSDVAYYYLSVNGNGKRIQVASSPAPGGNSVSSFNGRFFHELDTFNFLSSGKEWYGEEFSGAPGKTLSRRFTLSFPQVIPGSGILIKTRVLSRSVGNAGRFDFKINAQPAGQVIINPVNGGLYDPLANEVTATFSGISAAGDQLLDLQYVPGSFNAQGWLNWFEGFYRAKLSLNGISQLMFRDWNSVGSGIADFTIADAVAGTQVWDITDPSEPVRVAGNINGTDYRFSRDASQLHEYICFKPSGFLIPVAAGRIANQDLHQAAPADLLIVTHSSLIEQAERLAGIHREKDALRVRVVTIDQVYNEISSGIPDPVAIRDLVKMYHDRFAAIPGDRLRYLLLFGDASFDPRGKIFPGADLVPIYQNDVTLDPLNSYASDDFFGFLDDNEDISSGVILNLLDVGIGRVPARNIEEAKNFVDKLEAYKSPAAMGPWRTQLSFVADDEDNNLHLQDAEQISAAAGFSSPLFNQHKIYLDAYHQESSAGGARYPGANQASNNRIFTGTLIWNYNGHGGPRRLAEENILDQETVNQWNNPQKLPLFITATCDFAPFDNPASQSLGENILLRAKTGGIALMTTNRLVFAFSNRVMNENYLRIALEADANGRYRSLGDAVRDAKNFTYQNFSDITNNRKFSLLGDPALTLAFAAMKIRLTSVNNIPAVLADTLRAGETVTIAGEVTDHSGNLVTDFNGQVYPSVFDKISNIQTLANDPTSQVTAFPVQQNLLFRGTASVVDGRFSFEFRVPRDILFNYGNGRVSLYAENAITDAAGVFSNVVIGGTGTAVSNDSEGPEIRAYLNDEMFVNGGTVNQNPVLILKLADSSGINTTGLGIGHDLVATLDHNNHQYFILNDYYQADLDSYQKGRVSFQLPLLEPGPHTLSIKAWDAMNNSAETELEFVVAKDEELALSHILNYPNPFTNATQFWFEHNRPGQPLKVQLQVMTMTGKIVKTFSEIITTAGNRFAGFDWDGRDEYGDKLGRGVYLYRLKVTAPGGEKKEAIEKLVIF